MTLIFRFITTYKLIKKNLYKEKMKEKAYPAFPELLLIAVAFYQFPISFI
jgi:hypothetical protein